MSELLNDVEVVVKTEDSPASANVFADIELAIGLAKDLRVQLNTVHPDVTKLIKKILFL